MASRQSGWFFRGQNCWSCCRPGRLSWKNWDLRSRSWCLGAGEAAAPIGFSSCRKLRGWRNHRNVGKRRSSPNRNDMLRMCEFSMVFVVQRLQRSSYPNIFRQSRFKAQVVFLVERDLMPMLAVSALPPGSNGPSDQVSMNSLEPEATKISFIPPKRFSNIWHLII